MTKPATPITIIPYDPRWPEEFAELAAWLRPALGTLALRIDHIGSTAVPGLAAKDIIDIQVTVADLVPEITEGLTPLGFTLRTDITGDHQPPGAVADAQQWAKLYYRAPATVRPLHLHVRAAGRANGRYALLLRDYLRSHPIAAGAYAQIKQRLAAHAPSDWDLYYDIKDPVCDVIWAAAEAWAATTCWNEQMR
jgi:GrpB-like predicted nucleotidyltransferase (UPF0157 family)